MAFFEFRHYRIVEGKMDEWVKLMEEEIIPFQIQKGMVVIGSFRGEEDPNLYVWVRRFDSEEQRKKLYEAVYESDTWKNELTDRVGDILIREEIKVHRLSPTPRSVIR